jgi:heme iron utilization protein
MNGDIERPILIDVRQNLTEGDDFKTIQKEVRALFEKQPFAVLATQGNDITDASLVTIAVSRNMKHIVFATPVRTGKYNFIVANENVSILVDDRTLHQDNINQISALTVFGKAKALTGAEEIHKWGKLLTDKHPALMDFVKAPTSAIILVRVTRYLYVKHFQDLWEWNPDV